MDSVMVGCRLLFCVSWCCLVVLDGFFGGWLCGVADGFCDGW